MEPVWIISVLLVVIQILVSLYIRSRNTYYEKRFGELNRLIELNRDRNNNSDGKIDKVTDDLHKVKEDVATHAEKHRNSEKSIDRIETLVTEIHTNIVKRQATG